MRPIKFRAWHRHSNVMVYDSNGGDCLQWLKEGQPLNVMQYTGLKDRNGKEIYEGDVLDWAMEGEPICDRVVTVKFENGAFEIPYRDSALWKVIGNVWSG